MRKICVFSAATVSNNPEYLESAKQLGKVLAMKKISLVYGGADAGLMGQLANSVMEFGGEAIGIMAKVLLSQEMAHKGLTKLHIVDSMPERKRMMAEMADGFITLPGGLGTLEETFEVWNSIKIGLYKKPLGFLNVNGYFDFLFKFLDGAVQEGLLKKEHRQLVELSDDPSSLIELLCKSPVQRIIANCRQ